MYDKIAAPTTEEKLQRVQERKKALDDLDAFVALAKEPSAVEFPILKTKLSEIHRAFPDDIKRTEYTSFNAASEKVLVICKALTGMTRQEILTVDQKDEIAAVKLLGILIVYGKAVENDLNLTVVSAKLRFVQKKYYALAALAVESEQNVKLIQKYRNLLNNINPTALSKMGLLLGAALQRAKNPRANVGTRLKSLMGELKAAVGGSQASTAILQALSGFTLKGEYQALLEQANEALQGIVIETGTKADQGTADGRIASLMTQVRNIQGNSKLGKGEKINQIADLLDKSDLDDAVKAAVRVNAIKEELEYTDISDIGAGLVLNKEQDDAMNSDKAVTYISAGAGSGKTRVLAGRVLKFLSEQGTTPYNIIAVSFTKKSALELRSRVRKNKSYAKIGPEALENIDNTLIGRTIHSVAYEIASLYNPRTKRADIIEGYDQFNYYQKAIAEIKKGTLNPSWKDGVPVDPPIVQTEEYSKLSDEGRAMGLMALNLYNTSKYIYHVKKIRRGAEWAKINLEVFGSLVDSRAILNPNDSAWGVEVQPTNEKQQPITPRDRFIAEIQTPGRGQTVLDRFNMKWDGYRLESNAKTASATDAAALWYRIGATDIQIEADGLTPGNLGLYITKAKAEYMHPKDCVDRESATQGRASLFPAAYGAYQALLNQEGKADFDDAMLMGVSTLSDPTAREKAAARFKHILVDEAQDLNAVQRDFFGLILGTHEVSEGKVVKKAEAPTEGKSLTLIGDPKQTIYGFRGATDEQFVSGATYAADENNTDQGLYSLTTNYRSGRNIVNAANMLISRELKGKATEAGGICYAPIEAEKGEIQYKSALNVKEATNEFADFITQSRDNANNTGIPFKYRDFGLACRTNVEVIPYALALFEKGIPFRSGVDPFKHPASKAVLNYLNLLSTDQKENFVAVKAVLNDLLNIQMDDGLYNKYRAKLEDPSDTQTILQWATRVKGRNQRLTADTTKGRLQEILPTTEVTTLDQLADAFDKLAAVVDAADKAESTGDFIRMIMGDLPIPGFGNLTDSAGMTLRNKLELKGNKSAKAAKGADKTKAKGADKTKETTSEETSAEVETVSADAEGEGGEDLDAQEGMEEDAKMAVYANPLDVLIRMVSSLNIATKSQTVTKVVQEFLGKVKKVRSDAKKPLSEFTEKELDGMVTLDTAHGWKGLECEHLYLPMTARWPSDKINRSTELLSKEIEGETPDARSIRLKKINRQEEARLAYVAVTRGKKSVRILSYTEEKNVKTKNGSKSLRLQPSPFIEQMGLCDINSPEEGATATTARTASFDGIDASIWSEMARNGFDPDRI